MGMCTNCGTNNPDFMIYCGNCGQVLANTCSFCGQINGPNNRFCGRCGNQMAGTAPPSAPPPVKFQVLEQVHSQPARPRQPRYEQTFREPNPVPEQKRIEPGLTRQTGVCQNCGSRNIIVYGGGSGMCNDCRRAFM